VGRHPCRARSLLHPPLLELGIAFDIRARRPLPAPAKTGEPFLEIKEERIVLLLAVVADVHASFRLARHDCPHRCKAGRRNRLRLDAFAAGAADEKAGQIFGPRQATGMRRQNPLRTAPHKWPCVVKTVGGANSPRPSGADKVKCRCALYVPGWSARPMCGRTGLSVTENNMGHRPMPFDHGRRWGWGGESAIKNVLVS